MKKKIGIISTLLVVVISTISVILLTNKDDNKSINLDNGIAYYYETASDSHSYSNGEAFAWTDEYVLNVEKSECNNKKNPIDIISWDRDNQAVLMNSNLTTNCSLYFDVKNYHDKCSDNSLSCVIAKKTGTSVGDKEGEELIYHDGFIDVNNDGKYDDAGDKSYRYSGDNPNNFVCFGSDEESCPDTNLYRIIGVFPFENEQGETEYRVKLIKSEYITEDELGLTKSGTYNADTNTENGMQGIESRVKKTTDIHTFKWIGDNSNNNWNNSPIKKSLNDSSAGYLSKIDGKWRSKIADTTWFIGGMTTTYFNKNAKATYDLELGENRLKEKEKKCVDTTTEYVSCTQNLLETEANVGLIYVSDYLFAYNQKNWITPNTSYTFGTNSNNWLYNGLYEFTITRFFDVIKTEEDAVFHIDIFGYIGRYSSRSIQTVRPTFYLKSDTTYAKGDGTYENPYRINVN